MVPLALLLSLMLPFAQTSPVMEAVDVPVKVSEFPPLPPQPAGLSVWMAAPFVPAFRASAVAIAPTWMVGPDPSTCMIATGMAPVPVTVKLIPAIDLFSTAMVSR